jgi:hypothetical protein
VTNTTVLDYPPRHPLADFGFSRKTPACSVLETPMLT